MAKSYTPRTGGHPATCRGSIGRGSSASLVENCGKAYQRASKLAGKSAPEPSEHGLTRKEVRRQLGQRPGLAFAGLLKMVLPTRSFKAGSITAADVCSQMSDRYPSFTKSAAETAIRLRFRDFVNIYRKALDLNEQDAAHRVRDLLEVAQAQLAG